MFRFDGFIEYCNWIGGLMREGGWYWMGFLFLPYFCSLTRKKLTSLFLFVPSPCRPLCISSSTVRKARKSAQAYFREYRETKPVGQLVKSTASVMQEYTQSGGVRPFGVSLLVAGMDGDGVPRLFQVDPSGAYFGWKATAIGKVSLREMREGIRLYILFIHIRFVLTRARAHPIASQ